MKKLYILRHAPTRWNELKLIQGQSNTPLGEEGIRIAQLWQIPFETKDLLCLSSPLKRCVETAEIMGFRPSVEPLLIEMNWGIFEGKTLRDLYDEMGSMMAEFEALGIDFLPPMGESPREVRRRVKKCIDQYLSTPQDLLIFSHKGVIRALYSLATNWDMKDDPKDKLKDNTAHCFTISPTGDVSIDRLNIPLIP